MKGYNTIANPAVGHRAIRGLGRPQSDHRTRRQYSFGYPEHRDQNLLHRRRCVFDIICLIHGGQRQVEVAVLLVFIKSTSQGATQPYVFTLGETSCSLLVTASGKYSRVETPRGKLS